VFFVNCNFGLLGMALLGSWAFVNFDFGHCTGALGLLGSWVLDS
jgi:hypothetical protein